LAIAMKWVIVVVITNLDQLSWVKRVLVKEGFIATISLRAWKIRTYFYNLWNFNSIFLLEPNNIPDNTIDKIAVIKAVMPTIKSSFRFIYLTSLVA
jgi:hypothetical protein